MIVPAEAVVLRDGRSSVFLVGPEDTVTQVEVEVGRRTHDSVEIRGTLKEGDRVAVRGAGFLNEGDHVKRVERSGEAVSA